MGLQDGEAAQAVDTAKHILFIYVEAFAMFAGVITICLILYRVYNNPKIPSVVANRVLFGLLTFGLVVYLFREFGDKLSSDVFSFAIGGVVGAILTIITFLYDKDKEHVDDDDTEPLDLTS